MTIPTLRQLLADVLAEANFNWQMSEECQAVVSLAEHEADALLASPELAAIIDLAAVTLKASELRKFAIIGMSPEVRALLQDWQANRAEQKPTP